MTSKGAHLMNQSDDLEYQLDTLAIRTGHTRSFEGEHGDPILYMKTLLKQLQNFLVKFKEISILVLPIRLYQCLKNA
jgi:hypothetical protein